MRKIDSPYYIVELFDIETDQKILQTRVPKYLFSWIFETTYREEGTEQEMLEQELLTYVFKKHGIDEDSGDVYYNLK